MILDIKGTLVNAFIEPQFKEVSSGHLVTIQFSDLDALGKFKHHIQGDTRIDLTDKYFHFIGYTQLLDLNCHISGTRIALEDLLVSRDVSPAPAAYSWRGWEDDTEDEDGNPIQGDDWRGYSLPEEIEDARGALSVSLIEFYVYPIFRLPVELEKVKPADF
jgi:hypothetical protein